jgi:prepilin-type N-terminal cleavage/methylation domain-containing protein
VKTRPIRNNGFTLIEIIVAVGVLTLFIGVIYSTFYGTIRAIRATEQITDSFQPARVILNRITRDLQGAVHVLNDPRYVFNGIDSYGGDPKHDRIDFITAANIITGDGAPVSDLAEVSYYIDRNYQSNGYLVRREDVYLDNEPAKGGKLKVIAENITGISFQYFLIEKKEDEAVLSDKEKEDEKKAIWDKIQDPENWHDEWDWKKNPFLPIMVKIELSLLDQDKKETSFSTVVFLNRDPETYLAANPVQPESREIPDDGTNTGGPKGPGGPEDSRGEKGTDRPDGTDRPHIDKPIREKEPVKSQ